MLYTANNTPTVHFRLPQSNRGSRQRRCWPHSGSVSGKFSCARRQQHCYESVHPMFLSTACPNKPPSAIGFLGPCAINTPHTHPRATEINFSVNGTLRGGFLAENGAKFIEVTLNPGEAAIFPQAAIHFEMNTGCGEYSRPFLGYKCSCDA